MGKIELGAAFEYRLDGLVGKLGAGVDDFSEQGVVFGEKVAGARDAEDVADFAKQAAAMEPVVVVAVALLEKFEPALGPGDHFAIHEDVVLGDAAGVELETVPVVFFPVAAGLEEVVNLGGNGRRAGLLQLDHAPGVAHLFPATGELLDDLALELGAQTGVRAETTVAFDVTAETRAAASVQGVVLPSGIVI